MKQVAGSVLTGRTVLIAILGFFAVVTAVNLAMVALALSSNPGVVVEHAYLEGIRYNERVAQSRRQAALGWRYAVAYDKAAGRLAFTVLDDRGRPVAGLAARARLGRPAEGGDDREVALVGAAPGRYVADVALPLPGRWLVDIEALTPAGIAVRVRDELWRD